jgi:hypothetical protein
VKREWTHGIKIYAIWKSKGVGAMALPIRSASLFKRFKTESFGLVFTENPHKLISPFLCLGPFATVYTTVRRVQERRGNINEMEERDGKKKRH